MSPVEYRKGFIFWFERHNEKSLVNQATEPQHYRITLVIRMSVRWPSEETPAESREISFLRALQMAIEHQVPLVIGEAVKLELSERIFHKLNSTLLHIIGEGFMDTRPVLTSSGHSVFQCGGRRARLILDNIVIEHTCFREHHKDIGACIFGLNQSLITITNCQLRSHHGFAVWGVQRANISLESCDISSASRSGCVSFGRSCLSVAHCRIHHCRLHGVCTRGGTYMHSIPLSRMIHLCIRLSLVHSIVCFFHSL